MRRKSLPELLLGFIKKLMIISFAQNPTNVAMVEFDILSPKPLNVSFVSIYFYHLQKERNGFFKSMRSSAATDYL